MTTRYIITFDDYVQLLQDSTATLVNKFKRLKVQDNAKGFYVIDDNGDAKCLDFPE